MLIIRKKNIIYIIHFESLWKKWQKCSKSAFTLANKVNQCQHHKVRILHQAFKSLDLITVTCNRPSTQTFKVNPPASQTPQKQLCLVGDKETLHREIFMRQWYGNYFTTEKHCKLLVFVIKESKSIFQILTSSKNLFFLIFC